MATAWIEVPDPEVTESWWDDSSEADGEYDWVYPDGRLSAAFKYGSPWHSVFSPEPAPTVLDVEWVRGQRDAHFRANGEFQLAGLTHDAAYHRGYWAALQAVLFKLGSGSNE